MKLQCWLTSLLISAALLGCGGDTATDWSRFRGPNGQGLSPASDLPIVWSATEGVRWKAEVPGKGNSSPIVSDGHIFLTTALEVAEPTASGEEQVRRAVLAYDLASGEKLWQRELFSGPAGRRHRMNTFAAPTPVADGENVFVFFGSVLAKLDTTGSVVWQHEVESNFIERSHYGASSSPVLTNDSVIVFLDREVNEPQHKGWLAAFAKDTGERRWRVEWTASCCSYTTPLVVDRGSGEEVLVLHSGAMVSYDAATGKELWREEVPIWQAVASPVLDGDLLGLSGGAHNIRHTVFFRLAGSGAETAREELWRDPRQAPHTASPVLYQGLFYAVTDNGILTCWDAETGEIVWRERLEQWHNRSSLLAGDGKIYIPSTGGRTSVLEAGREFKLLAQNDLDSTHCNATPAIADGCLLFRTDEFLYCVEGTGSHALSATDPAANKA